MIINGVDTSKHSLDLPKEFVMPKKVKGRVVHIDADFLAYQVSADEAKTFEDMQHNHDERVEKIKMMSGATEHVLHLTPKESDKGYRFSAAIQKEYQGNRKDKPKPKLLHAVRNWMAEERDALLYHDMEADDGMSIAAYAAKDPDKCVIATKDKDLLMCPGLMLDWDTGELDMLEDPFGHLYIDDTKSSKKLRGRGNLMFWAQMLMGDPADNIKGLPKVHDPRFISGKPKACGPVMAYDVLSQCKTNKECFNVVKDLYKQHGEAEGYQHWKTGKDIQWGKVFQSESRLLWMRRTNELDDALIWMQEVING